jgi:hypothetical protein
LHCPPCEGTTPTKPDPVSGPWPVNKTLDAGPSAYSDLAVLPDGTVLCLYEKTSDIAAARFNLEWLSTEAAVR